MKTALRRFNGAVERDPAIDAWTKEHAGELGVVAHQWFVVIRKCRDEVRAGCSCMTAIRLHVYEICPSVRQCIHLARKRGVLSRRSAPGSGPLVARHRKVHAPCEAKTGTATNAAVLRRLIDTAYSDIKARVENG
jgi:hypothetical protein